MDNNLVVTEEAIFTNELDEDWSIGEYRPVRANQRRRPRPARPPRYQPVSCLPFCVALRGLIFIDMLSDEVRPRDEIRHKGVVEGV